jgi:hypothetical protein
MQTLKEIIAAGIVLISLFLFTGCRTYQQGTQDMQTNYENPYWAPPYYPGVRYYYLPDIETYYDVYTREFIFLDRARWIYSPYLPSYYSGFDLNNSFVVIVNSNIYQPWMHHQYYISHFPRFYYRDYYDRSNIPYVRGYNENSRSAVYWGENERHRARSWNDENFRNNRQFRYSREDRMQQTVIRNQPGQPSPGSRTGENGAPANLPSDRGENPAARPPQDTGNPAARPADTPADQQPSATPGSRRSQSTNYYGRPIGQPVKVDRQMKTETESGTKEGSRSRNENSKSNSGRR